MRRGAPRTMTVIHSHDQSYSGNLIAGANGPGLTYTRDGNQQLSACLKTNHIKGFIYP